jgi:putative transposase
MLNLIDEHSRECLMIGSERRWSSGNVIEVLADVMVTKGVTRHIRSDNGLEFVANNLRQWLSETGAKTLYIDPVHRGRTATARASARSCATSSLTGELFYSMKEVRVLAERWCVHCNTVRPHSSLGCRPPAPIPGHHRAWSVGRRDERSDSRL